MTTRRTNERASERASKQLSERSCSRRWKRKQCVPRKEQCASSRRNRQRAREDGEIASAIARSRSRSPPLHEIVHWGCRCRSPGCRLEKSRDCKGTHCLPCMPSTRCSYAMNSTLSLIIQQRNNDNDNNSPRTNSTKSYATLFCVHRTDYRSENSQHTHISAYMDRKPQRNTGYSMNRNNSTQLNSTQLNSTQQ